MLVLDTMELWQLVYQANRYFITAQDNGLKEYNVTLQQSLIMAFIYLNPNENVTQRLIEKKMKLSNPTVTNIIKVMISNNLIYKIQDKEDKRRYYLYLTPKALELAPKCMEQMERMDKILWKNITLEEIRTMIKILKKLDIK